MTLEETRTRSPVPELPDGLLGRIVEGVNPRRVILFGSQAQGKAGPDSDWDVLIVVDDDVPAEKIGWRAMYEVHRGINAAIDLIPCRESTFQDRMDIIGSLPWIVATEGVVVYERDTGA